MLPEMLRGADAVRLSVKLRAARSRGGLADGSTSDHSR
jgi:hypothetical protein